MREQRRDCQIVGIKFVLSHQQRELSASTVCVCVCVRDYKHVCECVIMYTCVRVYAACNLLINLSALVMHKLMFNNSCGLPTRRQAVLHNSLPAGIPCILYNEYDTYTLSHSHSHTQRHSHTSR